MIFTRKAALIFIHAMFDDVKLDIDPTDVPSGTDPNFYASLASRINFGAAEEKVAVRIMITRGGQELAVINKEKGEIWTISLVEDYETDGAMAAFRGMKVETIPSRLGTKPYFEASFNGEGTSLHADFHSGIHLKGERIEQALQALIDTGMFTPTSLSHLALCKAAIQAS